MHYTKIFKRSNELLCQHIESYFTGGKVDRRGWYTLKNFDRGENHLGSFGICVSGSKIGAVKDFADDSYNTNITAFYAKVNGLKNMDAAKRILEKHDHEFYKEAFESQKVTMTPIFPIPEDIYKRDFTTFCNKDKYIKNNIDWVYEYRDVQNNLLYVSVRLKKPFTDSNGKKRKLLAVSYFHHKTEIKEWDGLTWYKHAFAGKAFPFSRQYELSKRKEQSIIIVEGEKAAYYLESVLPKDKWIVTCNGSSSNLMNAESYDIFKKLNINHVFYWPDNDDAGKNVIGFIKERFDNVSVLKIPEDMPLKWDAADAVISGWNKEKIENFIFNNLYNTEEIDPQFFKPVSHDHENFFFMSYRLGLVKTVKQESITLGFLRIMAPREYWTNKYPIRNKNNGAYDTDSAIEDIVAMGLKTPYHETGKIRQSGAWEDDGRYVFHYGTGLIVDGKKVGLFDFKTNNIYEKKGFLSFSDNGSKEIDMRSIAKIIKRFSIPSPQEKYLFLGWIMMSLLGGAFDWRPHIWLTGEAGSGKTSAIDFIKLILGAAVIKETGGSTEAGIRQRLKVSTLPVLIDELENMDDKTNKNLKAIKALIRQASSGSRVSRGTADHSGIDFAVQSMFCVGSISPQIAENADLTRFSIINFDKKLTSTSGWIETEKMIIDVLTPGYLNHFKNYLITHSKEIVGYTKMAYSVFSELEFNSRLSQQYSVLTMGAFFCMKNGTDITREGFKTFLKKNFNFYDQIIAGSVPAAEQCFSIILQKVVEYKQPSGTIDKMSIFDLLDIYKEKIDQRETPQYNETMRSIIKAVKPYGFLVNHDDCDGDILFVYNAVLVKEILKFTQFSGDIKEIIRRHPHAKNIISNTFYAGGRGAAIRFSYDILYNKIGIEKKETETLNKDFEDEIPF